MIILFEGPDGAGKTTLAKAIANECGYPYYKDVHGYENAQANKTKEITTFANTFFADFIRSVPVNVILDRYYPTEWVYSKVYRRETDMSALEYTDKAFSEVGAYLILCIKTSGYHHSIEHITPESVSDVHSAYLEFLCWTKIKNILMLDMTDQDIQMQMKKVLSFLVRLRHE